MSSVVDAKQHAVHDDKTRPLSSADRPQVDGHRSLLIRSIPNFICLSNARLTRLRRPENILEEYLGAEKVDSTRLKFC
jgi:hypothetical protein